MIHVAADLEVAAKRYGVPDLVLPVDDEYGD